MAATVVIEERNGVSAGTPTIISALPMGSIDSANLDPVAHPISKGNNSFEKWLRLKITALNGVLVLDNVQIYLYSIGTGFVTGESLLTNLTENDLVYAPISYPSSGPVSTDSIYATKQLPSQSTSQANVGIGGNLAGSIVPATSLPAYTDYAVLQLKTTLSSPSGNVQQKTLYLQWDEQ